MVIQEDYRFLGVEKREKWRATVYGYDVSSWGDKNVLELHSYNCTTL